MEYIKVQNRDLKTSSEDDSRTRTPFTNDFIKDRLETSVQPNASKFSAWEVKKTKTCS